ncbi:TetR/AcrR family transcriptional regulator [Paenibacillus xanthanilyticus]|uniref:TetR/AcrR family transcriptional regulator n=1 Tax=Paenibacillus xanthanilyticus TaxID=1783531 RepID=A0ABV8JYF8_9BACL
MPKIVDHQQRKEELAEAAWRVIRKEGLDGLSVRRVAEEAGISLGSLRHYFHTQDELIAFSMRLISERANARIDRLPFNGQPYHDMMLVLAELIPLDEERLSEAEVWLAFSGKAVSDPVIRELSREVFDSLYVGFRRSLEQLIAHKLTREGIDASLESRRLHALIDGLVLHLATFPERLGREEVMQVVAYHLQSILKDGHADAP